MNKHHHPSIMRHTPWRVSDAAWLGLLMAIGSLFGARVLSFQFHGEGLRQIWAAINQPWKLVWDATATAPLAAFFHRLHFNAFGAEPFAHYLALSIWWIAAMALLFCWARRESTLLTGILAVLLCYSFPSSTFILFSTSGMAVIAGAVFQLGVMVAFRDALLSVSFQRIFLMLMLFVLAVGVKPMTLVFLPAACIAIAMTTETGTAARRYFLSGAVVILAVGLAIFIPSIREILLAPHSLIPGDIHWFEGWADHASGLWPGWTAKWMGALFITYALIRAGETGWWGLGLFLPIAGLIYFACRYYHLSPHEAYAIALTLYVNWLWLTPWRRLTAPALIWLLLSFWTLPMRPEASAAALDAALALAFTLSAIAVPVALKGYAAFRRGRRIIQNTVRILLALGLICAVPVMLYHAYANHSASARSEALIRHQPLALLLDQVKRDLKDFVPYPIYANLGDYTTIETALAVALFNDPSLELYEGVRPSNAFRLEAVLGVPYAYSLRPTALHLWVIPSSPPHTPIWNDPYFMPERWIEHLISECDSTYGWSSNGPMSVVHNPNSGMIGERSIRHRRLDASEPLIFQLQSDLRGTMLLGSTDFMVTMWLQTTDWNAIETMEVRMLLYDESWHWSNIAPDAIRMRSGWRRIQLRSQEASWLRSPERLLSNVTMEWSVNASTNHRREVFELGIDDIRMYKRR